VNGRQRTARWYGGKCRPKSALGQQPTKGISHEARLWDAPNLKSESCLPAGRGPNESRPRQWRYGALGKAAQVDTGNRYAELLQSLKPVSISAVANKRSYVGSPCEQSSRDASTEITGSSRHDDGRVIHDSDIRERMASVQSGRRPEWESTRDFFGR